MKAATRHGFAILLKSCISIHAAREGGDADNANSKQLWDISIHAAREGGDTYACVTVHLKRISIHAAREGGDPAGCSGCRRAGYFNPRRP